MNKRIKQATQSMVVLLLPATASAHTGPAHYHPEELLGALAAVVIVGLLLKLGTRKR